MINALTIDVEDYFQVAALSPVISRAAWDQCEWRLAHTMTRILDVLARHEVRATFFTLGWVARRHPSLVRDIVLGGHELASHGEDHKRVSDQSPGEFFDDILRARHVLEETGGVAVKGYRAPNFSLNERTPWAHGLIAQAGYRYSSSVYPVRHDHYGMPDAPRTPRRLLAGVVEIPVSTVRLANRNWPAGGGGFFRLLPYSISRGLIRRVNGAEGQPAVFYFHPWEIDAGQPKVAGLSFKSRTRHYLNLHRTQARLERLLSDFQWGRMDEVFASVVAA